MSTDCEDLSMNTVKGIVNYVVEPFTHVCNLSFINSNISDKMKVAKVVLL